jgi:putative endopeptidase
MKRRVRLMGFAAGLALAVVAGGLVLAQTDPQKTSLAAPRMGAWGFDLAGRDTAAAPGEDFYKAVAGVYTDKLVIPADRTRWGSFDALGDLSDARSRAVIEKAAANPKGNKDAVQIGTLYNSFMDEKTVDALGAKPLAGDLATVKAANTKAKMATLMGKSSATFFSGVFAAYVGDDQKVPDSTAAFISTAGLGMPDRDYYLKPNFAAQKQSYRDYMAATLKAIGWADPDKSADAVVAFETQIAEVSWTRAEQRDDVKMYNAKSPAELAALAPGFPWTEFLAAEGLSGQKRLVVNQVTAFPKIAAIYDATPMATLQAWQAFNVADSASPYLSKDFSDRRFNFRGKTLSGQPEQQPRWKRAVGLTGGVLGESVGKLYVAEYFTPQAKAEMVKLVDNLRVALRGRIERLDWMSPATKAEALTKLRKMNVKIAYPDKWRDYSKYLVKSGDLYGNIERGSAYEWAYQLNKLGKPVDRMEWGMTPQTVNAYFDPPKNEIVFPAAILQPPFFDPMADPAVNYGGIGAVIGHEITHAFDDQGRQSDADGQLRDWWTPQDAERFAVQAKKLGAQYAAFEPLPGLHINPELTMGENIADMGGVLIAYDAYKLSLGGKTAPVLDGYTGDQRFFLAWAQVWRGKVRDERLKQSLVTDPHSPSYFRANGGVRNSDAFYAAFNIKPGDKMYVTPADRVRIW